MGGEGAGGCRAGRGERRPRGSVEAVVASVRVPGVGGADTWHVAAASSVRGGEVQTARAGGLVAAGVKVCRFSRPLVPVVLSWR